MKVKGEPGVFIPYEEVVKKLTAPVYGAIDLVSLGLFYSEHFVRDAIAEGRLKSQKINKRAVIVCRDDLLEYWSKYRNTPYEPANNTVMIKVTLSEADAIAALVHHGQKRVDKEFSKDDLFRNVIHYLRKISANAESYPTIFAKRY